MNNYSKFIVLLICLLITAPLFGAENKKLIYEDKDLYIRVFLRSPEQITAFYLGREFEQKAVERIASTCNVTVIIKNKTYDALWLELDNWQFSQKGKSIQRLTRDYWAQQWQEVNLKQAHRSTFGWTLMPEVRDLRLDEGVGGSLYLPLQQNHFTLTLNFNTGADKQGKKRSVTFDQLFCRKNTDPDDE